MKTKQLLTHPSFSKLVVDGETVARINKLNDGTYAMICGTFYEIGSQDVAFNWITAQSLAVALSN